MELVQIKEAIKADRRVLLKKPHFFFYLPALVWRSVKSRWQSPGDVVYLTETDLSGGHPLLEKPLPQGLQASVLTTPEQFEPLARQRMREDGDGHAYWPEVSARLERSDYAIVLSDKVNPLAYLFIGEGSADFQQVHTRLPLPTGCFACYDVYTFSKWRGKGLYAVLLGAAFREMRGRGFDRMWLWVMPHNQVSVKVHHALRIDRVVKVLRERYRFGFRFRKTETADHSLEQLIHD